jgi:NAD+ synthase (glutamine-hydrolysing)
MFSKQGNRMRIGVAQLNPTVGDLEGNLALAIDAYEQLAGQNVDLVVYPELFLCGYPPRDLLLKENFGNDSQDCLLEFVKSTGPVPALIGYAEPVASKVQPFYNAATWCAEGKIIQIFHKRLLPTYDVFDEKRYFVEGDRSFFISHNGKSIAVTICEDIWNTDQVNYSNDPLDEIEQGNPDLLINLSASPWHMRKDEQRIKLLGKVAKKCKCPVVYVNAVGGNDELVFDGFSLSVNQDGTLQNYSDSFSEKIEVHDFADEGSACYPSISPMESLRQALVLGVKDYAHKSGFKKGLIGLSGGIDSALTAAIAVEALGKENVIGISLPSSISSQHSKEDAEELAKNLGIEFHTLPIQSIVDAASVELAPLFKDRPLDVTEENIQARSRGLLLMAVSNKMGALLLTTGNKSELAVGYCTLYGDMCGGLAVISDVPKTHVFQLARHYNRENILIPVNSIEKPPSAELRPDQKDSDSLPEYEILDAILEAYVEQGQSIKSILKNGFEEEIVRKIIRLVDLNEYKRNQAAPGIKTTPLAFGVGRRIPIVQKYKN